MTKAKQIEIALFAIRSLAQQIGLAVESIMLELTLIEDKDRLFFNSKERKKIDRAERMS